MCVLDTLERSVYHKYSKINTQPLSNNTNLHNDTNYSALAAIFYWTQICLILKTTELFSMFTTIYITPTLSLSLFWRKGG